MIRIVAIAVTFISVGLKFMCSAEHLSTDDKWARKIPQSLSSSTEQTRQEFTTPQLILIDRPASSAKPFKILTSSEKPFFVDHVSAKESCKKLGSEWRLPHEEELYGLRASLATDHKLKNPLGTKINFSRQKYWSQSETAPNLIKSVRMTGSSTRDANHPQDLLGVLCTLDTNG